jgi:hypothetical protein
MTISGQRKKKQAKNLTAFFMAQQLHGTVGALHFQKLKKERKNILLTK